MSARKLWRHARAAARQGRDTFAIRCLRRLIARSPAPDPDLDPDRDPDRHRDRTPRRLDCYVLLGDVCLRTQRYADALDAYLQALQLAPHDVDVHLALVQALTAQGLYAEAIPVLERARRLDPARALVHVELGDALCASGGAGAAQPEVLEHYQRARHCDPAEARALRGLARVSLARSSAASSGAAAGEMAEVEEAVHMLRGVLNVRPRDVLACRLLIDGLERLGRVDDLVGAWFALGAALEAGGEGDSHVDLSGAARAYEAAIACKGDCLRAWLKLADMQLALGQPGEAVRSLEAAVAIDPEQPAAHVNLGWARRMAGDFAGGWTESAWQYRASDKRRFEQPVWEGDPLGTRTLLLWADFALGDTIQDLRFLSRIRAAHPAARLLVECDRRLVSLLESSLSAATIDVVIAHKAPLPAFDCHLPLRRLPERLGIDVDTIPIDVPYLAVDPARTARRLQPREPHEPRQLPDSRETREHPEPPEPRKTVGLVWAGDQTRRDARTKSAALADFAPLAALPREGVRFVSLQLGPTVDELIAPPPGLRVGRVLDETCDVADTAAVIRTLDLVITVDTMIAHLAGALGVPVWVLAAHAPAWWLWHLTAPTGTDSGHSRWYPTMRVFRQTHAGDWDGVMQRICNTLRTELHTEARSPDST